MNVFGYKSAAVTSTNMDLVRLTGGLRLATGFASSHCGLAARRCVFHDVLCPENGLLDGFLKSRLRSFWGSGLDLYLNFDRPDLLL